MFASIAFENSVAQIASMRQLLSNLGQRLVDISGQNAKPVSKMLSLGAVFQRNTPTRQFVMFRLHGLIITSLYFSFSNFLKPPWIMVTKGKNDNNIRQNVTFSNHHCGGIFSGQSQS